MMRFQLYDMLMHSVGMPPNEERAIIGPSPLGKLVPNLMQVSHLCCHCSLLVTISVDL
jgi:hypothetical protein